MIMPDLQRSIIAVLKPLFPDKIKIAEEGSEDGYSVAVHHGAAQLINVSGPDPVAVVTELRNKVEQLAQQQQASFFERELARELAQARDRIKAGWDARLAKLQG